MKELESLIGAELNDAELELISGRGGEEGGFGGYGGGKGGYGGGVIKGGRNDNYILNNFSFRHNTNLSTAAITVPVSDFACNSFSNTYIGY